MLNSHPASSVPESKLSDMASSFGFSFFSFFIFFKNDMYVADAPHLNASFYSSQGVTQFIRILLQKGGIPAAPSGTATLLRLSPSYRFSVVSCRL